jgi:hypothetical protein
VGKGDKRRPCLIPAWLEDLRWDVAQGKCRRREQILRLCSCIYSYPEDETYLTQAELELLPGKDVL